MRNTFKVDDVLKRAYFENADLKPQVPSEVIPRLLPRSRPVHEVVPVDVFLPGCPPPADVIFGALVSAPRRDDARPVRHAVRTLGHAMGKTITIDPVTRIEGHAKITLQLDDAGHVSDARFHVTQFRGFEKFCEGRPFYEMPALMARICGICPVSHLIASAKACDAILAVRIPETAAMLRQVLNLAQMIQSHALSFFHLSSPDLLLGFDSDPAKRNIFGVLEKNPQDARDGVRLRRFGQQVIETLAGKRIHPAWLVPGGVDQALTADKRDLILSWLPECFEIVGRGRSRGRSSRSRGSGRRSAPSRTSRASSWA